MLNLFIFSVVSIAIALFATENTQTVWISFGQYRLESVPLYLVVLGGLLVGIFLSLLMSVVSSLSLRGQDSALRVTLQRLEERVHDLEVENERLQEGGEETEETQRPSLSPFAQLNKRFS